MKCPCTRRFFLTFCVLTLFEWPLISVAFTHLESCDPETFPKWRQSHCSFREMCEQKWTISGRAGLNIWERNAIVHAVNMLREFVASGSFSRLPGASNMEQMIWSDDMAELALRLYDQQCRTAREHLLEKHLKMNERFYLNKLEFVGKTERNELLRVQSLFLDTVFEPTVCGCEIDINDFKPGLRQPYDDFAQIMWAESFMIGCSRIRFVRDTDFDRFFVCFFGPGFSSTIGQNKVSIYQAGKPKCKTPSKVYPSLCANEMSENVTHPCLDRSFSVVYKSLCDASIYNITCDKIGTILAIILSCLHLTCDYELATIAKN
ncbi:Hypothetical predicted protein [Cloeon dipterum]|uniref:SCP domain-containing protein n=2 Tax=Cloeon dipterum TaxID=197152 RepID=A0A8S1D201_9INSE|nr:Hypothetical predicted protein [Cloeon dipterum]